MHPDWPETPADLVPLPQCPGPKLHAFDFKGPQNIEFVRVLGQGLHSHVLKVKIKGQEYALKLYSDPFYSECRAFGRLHETGHTDLAVPCYGYVLLDEEHERKLTEQFKLEYNGSVDFPGDEDMRGLYPGERSGKPPPLRGIIKKLGSTVDPWSPANLTVRTARRLLRDTIRLHQLGIFYLDLRPEQLVDNVMCDFSTAFTVPHFMASPELNPKLTEKDLAAMEHEVFLYTINDYWSVEEMILRHIAWPRQTSKVYELMTVFPGGVRGPHCPKPYYHLRRTSSRVEEMLRIYALADPRQFDWKAGAALKDRSNHKLRLAKTPKRWYLPCTPEKALKMKYDRMLCSTLEWKGKKRTLKKRAYLN
ncbi:hypothetical protein SPBR_03488 [Sporothrix brasiliensis 5110]|uniref:Protein kinase domain-containing protein n=1 Tax=Sporothrix brasiliensis 5110 TaxID=1398154 RepID=A0A0C2J0X0_9PEZI|nr:uncharacterized protein SPBR_03488 [Sporothrix brasiliensis 5110]KIH95026.1 hypothetical protein SPBR_03488 [Sporothrix brasiliensis 5110]